MCALTYTVWHHAALRFFHSFQPPSVLGFVFIPRLILESLAMLLQLHCFFLLFNRPDSIEGAREIIGVCSHNFFLLLYILYKSSSTGLLVLVASAWERGRALSFLSICADLLPLSPLLSLLMRVATTKGSWTFLSLLSFSHHLILFLNFFHSLLFT